MDANDLRERLPALELAVRSLTREEIARFAEVVRQPTSANHIWPPDDRFWFSRKADIKLSRAEDKVVRELWTRMNAGLVYAVTGKEVEAWIDRPGFFARLDRIGPRWSQIEGSAATILERELGGEVWLASIGIWNALCAALLAERLGTSLRDDLATSWSSVRPAQGIGLVTD
jgi:hypothetical protein